VAASAGKVLEFLQRNPGYVYSALLLGHDLYERAVTESNLSLSGPHLIDK